MTDNAAASAQKDTAQQHAHFSALASSWWDPHGPSRLLHLMNPMRHQFINTCLESATFPPPDPTTASQHYLDIGCGGGIFAESAARLSGTASVLGVDPNPEVLQVAREHAKRDPFLTLPTSNAGAGTEEQRSQRPRLRYLNTTLEDLPLPNPTESDGFDVVTLFEVIEHLPHPAQTLDSISQHIKPGGWMILSTIARTWTSWATTKVVAEDLLGMVPRGTHDWEKYLNWSEIQEWLRGSGKWNMQSSRVMGVVYVPGLGWKEVPRSEDYGNYFLGVRKS
ncbi:MAG: Hexaprenyldihydroxybenzoate methyltransferase, mitochondrial [Alyxoria varia]|nr:MAG: Hexaprenyldihydroxybenzoate methyltransferase, mitochondrial [Alyxoria varia]